MAEKKPNDFLAVIMAGGSGTRFWPASKSTLPKQYLTLFGNRSLIQHTVDRLELPPKNIWICSGQSQKPLLAAQLPEVTQLVLEPIARNTAPCLMYTVDCLLKAGISKDTVMVVLAADHYIGNAPKFREFLQKAVDFAKNENALVTLGILPTSPHTGYGYIESGTVEKGAIHRTKRFVEKPSLEKALGFLASGNFYWNAGIFIWKVGAIAEAFEKYCPEDWKRFRELKKDADAAAVFSAVKAQPIDIAVLEKADNVFVLPTDSTGWSDVGSWGALYDLSNQGESNFIMTGHVEAVESSGCLVKVPSSKNVALVGVQDLIIVEEGDTLLVSSKSKDQLVRTAAERFEKKK